MLQHVCPTAASRATRLEEPEYLTAWSLRPNRPYIDATNKEAVSRVHTMVWCSVATVDSKQRPRSRILHPIWEGNTGWIGTFRHSHKARHLAQNPHVSLAYIANITQPVYADCVAEWVDDPAVKQRIWDLFLHTPPPLGYDPAPLFGSPTDDNFGVLKLTPWRIELVTFPAESLNASPVWRRHPLRE